MISKPSSKLTLSGPMFLSSRAAATSSAEKYWQISTEGNTRSSWIGTRYNKNPSVRICRFVDQGQISQRGWWNQENEFIGYSSKKHLIQSQEVLATHAHKGPFTCYVSKHWTGWVGSEIGHFCLLTVHRGWVGELKYGSEEKGSWLYRCSSLLGFIMSKKQERLRSELLSEGKITNFLVFLT